MNYRTNRLICSLLEDSFGKLFWREISQLCIIINDTDLCGDNVHVSEFSIITNNDLTRLDATEL